MFGGLNKKKSNTKSSSSSLSFTSSWKKKYEEEAKSKFNLLLQVQEQQRIIQEQRRIIDELRTKVSKLEKSSPEKKRNKQNVNNNNNVNYYNNNKKNIVKNNSIVRPPGKRYLSINTSGVDSTASSISPVNRSAPVSPAMANSKNGKRRKSWQVKPSSLRYSPKTTGTLERADPLSPGLKAANLEFGRRKSFTIVTHSDWLKTQRLRRTSLSGDGGERRLSISSDKQSFNNNYNNRRRNSSSSISSYDNNNINNNNNNDNISIEDQLQAASNKLSSHMRNITKKRSMTMDDTSKLENIILEAKLRSSPKFYDDDKDDDTTTNINKTDGSSPKIFSTVRNELFLGQNNIDFFSFELFFVSGIHPTTLIEKVGNWQPDIIFQHPSNKNHAFNGSRLDSSTLSDFTFPEGVESFYVDDEETNIEKMKVKKDRHYFTLTDANEVYHGFCLTIAHPVLYGTKAEEQFILLDKNNIVSKEEEDNEDGIDINISNSDNDEINVDNNKEEKGSSNNENIRRKSSVLEETGDLLDALGDVEPELPTAFEKPDLSSFSQDDMPSDQPKRIQYVIPENIPENKNVKVVIGETQCIFTIPENALPGQTLTIELPLNPVMVKVRKRTNSIEPTSSSAANDVSIDSEKGKADEEGSSTKDTASSSSSSSSNNSKDGEDKKDETNSSADVVVHTNSRYNRAGSMSNNIEEDEPENWNQVLYIKRSYCFVSKYQQYNLHFKILERIALMDLASNVSEMDENNKSLYQQEDFKSIFYVLNKYRDVNLDQFENDGNQFINDEDDDDENRIVSLNGPSKMFTSTNTCTWPFNVKVRPIELLNAAAPKWTIVETFQRISFENIIQILSTLLMEKSVAIVSSDPAISYAVACAFTALLTPLEWQATFVPCLPSRLWNFLLAPVPFLVGLTSTPKHIESLKDVTFLLVDSDEVKNPTKLRLPNSDMIMSDKILNLSEDLTIIAGNKPSASKNMYVLSEKEDDIVNLCVGTCKNYINGILGDVRVHCIRNISSNDSSQSYVFLKDSYLERRNSFIGGAQIPYITRLVNTQLFSSWVDEVMMNDEV